MDERSYRLRAVLLIAKGDPNKLWEHESMELMGELVQAYEETEKELEERKKDILQLVQDCIDFKNERDEYKSCWEGTLKSLKTSLECIDHVKQERFTLEEIEESMKKNMNCHKYCLDCGEVSYQDLIKELRVQHGVN